jgi:hypothetical protein
MNELTADPSGLQYQGPGTSKKLSGSTTEDSKGVEVGWGWGGVSDGSGFLDKFLLACQNDLPITPEDAAY